MANHLVFIVVVLAISCALFASSWNLQNNKIVPSSPSQALKRDLLQGFKLSTIVASSAVLLPLIATADDAKKPKPKKMKILEE